MKLNDGRVVPAFLDRALRGLPMTVFGTGSQTRTFCYVSDLVDGLYRRDPKRRAGHRQSPRGARMGPAHST
jgi:nucleoside-diphosphate-sugar epimerase